MLSYLLIDSEASDNTLTSLYQNKIQLIFALLSIILPSHAFSQERYTFNGLLIEAGSQQPIPGASVRSGNDLALSDKEGRFKLQLYRGTHDIAISHLAFDTLRSAIQLDKDIAVRYEMSRKSSLIDEVSVIAKSGTGNRIAPSAQTLSAADIEKMPIFLGQRDPLKALLALPGTTKAGEGNSGLYVRGGTSGQNLIVFNDATIYNPSHLLGFFSVFNSTAVNEIKLYKSGIPTEYGGRLSSIVEINSSRKIADSVSGLAEASPLAASVSITAPLTSFWSVSASARKTFMNYTTWPLLSNLGLNSKTFNNLKYDFFDLNLNSNARIGSNNFLHLSAYTGGDDFKFSARDNISNSMDWHNRAGSLTWKSAFGQNAVLTSSASFSGYNFNFGLQQDNLSAGITSRIRDFSFKSGLAVYFNKHYLKGGINFTDHNFKPNTPSIKSFRLDYDLGTPNTYHTDESSVYLSDEITLSEHTGVYVGARLTYYRHKGPYTQTSGDSEEKTFDSNSVVSSFLYFEPSFTLRRSLSDQSSIKASYSRNVQPIHLISVTAVNFPADFWMPTLNSLPSEVGHQFSLGYFRNFGHAYESYVDLYFRNMKGLVEFSGGIMNLIDNLKIEENLFFGSGNSYGAEMFVKRKTGKLTGWIGYTLAKSDRSFADINNGSSFPAKYDRRHDLSVVSNYQLNQRWSFSALLTYATGSAFTSPTSRYLIGGNVVNEYGSYNRSRMPAYHRLDLGATLRGRSRKRFRTELNFSIYNVYNRNNPIYIYFQADGDIKQQRISVSSKSVALMPILPSVSYKVLF